MAKKGKLNLNQIEQIQGMSLEDLQGAVKTNQQRLEVMLSNPQVKQQLFQEQEQQKVKEQNPETFDMDSFIKANLDSATLEARPDYANGSSAASAINKSPLSIVDRMKMSIGDERGNLNFLKEKYSEVQKMKSGSLAVKDKDGMWYQVDPNGAGQGDAWDKTKEIAKDILGDLAGPIGTTAAIIGATVTAPATGGASIAAAASAGLGAALTRTSLGRLVGTYEATPEEQLKDIALETVLNAGGQAFALGIKPTAQVIGSMFKRGAKTLGKLSEPSVKILSQTQGALGGVGQEVAETWIKNGDDIGNALIKHGKKALSQESVTTNILKEQVMTHTKNFAEGTREALTKVYANGMDDVVREAGDSFAPKVGRSIEESFKEYAERGFGELLPNGKFKLASREAILAKQQAESSVNILSDIKGYKLLEDFTDTLNRYAGQFDLTGKRSVKQLMDFEQAIGQKVRELSLEASESGGVEVIKFLKGIELNVQNKIMQNSSKSLSPLGGNSKAYDLFKNLQSRYSGLKNSLSPILDAHTLAIKKGSDAAYTSLYDNLFKVSSLSSKGAVAKGSLAEAIQVLSPLSPKIAEAAHQMTINKAAVASLPIVKSGLIGQGALIGGITGSAAFGPSAMIPAAVTSPRLNFHVAKLAGSALKGLNWLQTLDPNMKTQLFNNPKMLSQFMTTIVNTPMVEESVKQEFMGKALSQDEQR